jgi:putative phosphoesterase
MRLGLIGDIHADVRALEDALRHLDALGVACILCAGDLVGYGAEPDEAVALVRDRGIPCIRGNHDRWALERRQVLGPRGWQPARLDDDTWAFLEGLPAAMAVEVGGRRLAVHHGAPGSDLEYVTPYKPLPASVVDFWAGPGADVLVLGHTHIPMIERMVGGGAIVNAGSVMGVPGVQTSSSFAVVDLDDLAVRVHDIRLGRVIRRDPLTLPDLG